MDKVDLNNFYSGGYFLIRAGHPGWEQLKTDLLPEMLISLSECICPKLSVHWGWNPGNKQAALNFGIPAEKLDAFVEWCNHTQDIEFDSMFHTLDAARRFVDQFVPNHDKLLLLGAGLPRHLEVANWREPSKGESYGIEKRIEAQLPIVQGGDPLGFDVLSFSYGDLAHSWLCSYLHVEMNQQFGIRPNQYGLLDNEQDAQKIYDWIAEDDMKGHRAEPEPYDYWLLLSYPLNG